MTDHAASYVICPAPGGDPHVMTHQRGRCTGCSWESPNVRDTIEAAVADADEHVVLTAAGWRPCTRCGCHVPPIAEIDPGGPDDPGDHLVLVTGPIEFDMVGERADNTITYRATTTTRFSTCATPYR